MREKVITLLTKLDDKDLILVWAFIEGYLSKKASN